MAVIDRMNERPKNAGAAMENIWSLCLVLLTAVVYLSAEKYHTYQRQWSVDQST
jgi:hypothetical protein